MRIVKSAIPVGHRRMPVPPVTHSGRWVTVPGRGIVVAMEEAETMVAAGRGRRHEMTKWYDRGGPLFHDFHNFSAFLVARVRSLGSWSLSLGLWGLFWRLRGRRQRNDPQSG